MYSVPTMLRCGQPPSRCGWCHSASLPWPFARASHHIGCLPRSSRFTGHGRRSHITLRSLRRINPIAWLFTGSLPQAVLFARCAIGRGQLRFSTGPPMRRLQAGTLVAFSLLYPLINVAQGFSFPRMATFGVPCPTTILTLGLLLVAEPPSWSLAAIPNRMGSRRRVRRVSAWRARGHHAIRRCRPPSRTIGDERSRHHQRAAVTGPRTRTMTYGESRM